MASAIFFGGRRINVPGAYSKIDASALAGLSPGAVGIVALLGTAEGGKPLSVEPEEADATRPGLVRERYRSGDLRTAAEFAFAPSSDEAVPGGAQRVISVKVNPATRSSAGLVDSNSDPSVDLQSSDWGQYTEQINISVEDGTIQGKKISIVLEDAEETLDNVGGDAVMEAEYTPGSNGYGSASVSVTATHFTVAATKSVAGLDSQISNQLAANDTLSVVSDDASDDQVVTVFGLNAASEPAKESITLNGTSAVAGTSTFSKVTGASLSGAAAGTVLVTTSDGNTTLFSFSAGTTTRGLNILTNAPAAGQITVSCTADLADELLVIRGLSAAGAEIAEVVPLDTANTTVVTTSASFAQILQLELAMTDASESVTLQLDAFRTSHSVFSTVQRVVDKLNADPAFTASSLAGNAATLQMIEIDHFSALNILSTAGSLFANLFAFIRAINQGSELIEAARASGASQVPANTAVPVFLQGGSEGTPDITHWQQAFDLLKKRRVNVVVPLTNDAAVHAQLLNHVRERAGVLRSEANGYIGLGDAEGTGETRASIKARIQAVQNRNVSALAQEAQRFDPATGESKFWPPYMLAAIAAGMQAGSPIGEPLTRKVIQITDVRNDASWSAIDDQDEMIDAGLMIAESVDGVGIRWVRSVTTHLSDDNPVFTEMSANESLNTAIFELRRRLENAFVGNRGLRGTVASMKGKANNILENLISDDIVFAFRSLVVEQVGDVFPVSVEISPILPINFIPITVHVTAPVGSA